MLFLSITLFMSSSALAALEAPKVLRCPAVPPAYVKMLTDLNTLKATIKKDAACEPLNKEVESLTGLIDQPRQNLTDLLKRVKETQTLDELDMETVRNYVESVTKKVFSLAELIERNEQCFSADEKKFTLSSLASITLDATNLAQTLSGPWSLPVAMGSQILIGIMRGLDQVVKTKGYDFTALEQRQSYVQSLCSYYNYRKDIEHHLFPKRRVNQLTQLRSSLDRNLSNLIRSCESCAKIVDLSRNPSTPGNMEVISNAADTANKRSAKPLGTYTVQTLNSLRWVAKEIERVNSDLDDHGSIGRDLVSETKADLDQFLFEKEAPRFVQFQFEKAQSLHGDFSSYLRKEGSALLIAAWPHVKGKYDFSTWYRMSDVELMKAVLGVLPDVSHAGNSTLGYRIRSFEQKATDLMERTFLAADVHLSYCVFFQKAKLFYQPLQTACENPRVATLVKQLKALEELREEEDHSISAILAVKDQDLSVDWADAMKKLMAGFLKEPLR